MIVIYWAALLGGLFLLLLSFFGPKARRQIGSSSSRSGEGDMFPDLQKVPFFTLTFWARFCTDFGTIGVVFGYFRLLEGGGLLATAVIIGAINGLLFHFLKQRKQSS